jgi:FkbM family methyltransferase
MLSDLIKLDRAELESRVRSLCMTARLSDEHLICRVLGKYIMYVDPHDRDITPHLALNGFWETWVTLALARQIQPGWLCVDVGANVGYFTLIMADLVGSEGVVLAIEPNTSMTQWLELNVEVNGLVDRVRIERYAAAEIDGNKVSLSVDKMIPGRGTICSSPDSQEHLQVTTATLDTLTAEWPRVDLVKIDAEGAEPEIWQGMQGLLMKNPDVRVFLEFTPSRYRDINGFLRKITMSGFSLRLVDSDGSFVPIEQNDLAALITGNEWLMLYLARN